MTSPVSPASTASAKPSLDRPGLLVMDVDSTLIDEEVIDELGDAAGCGERIARVTEQAMRGELDFREALRARDTLHAHGWKVGVVSGGFHEVVDRLADDAHIDYRLANRLETRDGVLTGKVLGDIVTKQVKLDSLHAWASELGLPMSQTVAMGDGANDIPMIHEAGLGIAFCAKPKTRDAAPAAITTRDLRLVLDFLN